MLNKYQEAILNSVKITSGNIIVQAVAGSGKTTTLELIAKEIPPQKDILLVCFNKSTAESFKGRFGDNCTCTTMHKLGYDIIKANTRGFIKISERKVQNVLKYDVLGYDNKLKWGTKADEKFYISYKKRITQLVSLVKAQGVGSNATEIWNGCIEAANLANIDLPNIAEFQAIFVDTYCSSLEKKYIDFDDMILYPVVFDMDFPSYDYILVDECQDLNEVQRKFLLKLQQSCGESRFIFVGDSAQSVYAFRGADINSMTNLKDAFNCTEYPLSINYRCDKNIIKRAQQILPSIEAREGAPDGVVETILPETMYEQVAVGDFIICRHNAPLVECGLHLISKGYKAKICNLDLKEAIEDLIAEVYRGNLITPENLYYNIKKKLEVAENKKQFYLVQHFNDLYDVIKAFEGWYKDGEELLGLVRDIFGEGDGNIKLTTIHKVKGLEADRVFIIHPELMPSPYAKTDYDLEQEKNLEYVAITRARHELYFVKGDEK